MKYLFTHWPDLEPRLAKKSALYLFDFDGTLAPIVRAPGGARMPAASRRLLQRLARRHPGRVGLISGRKLSDLKKRAGLSGLLMAGNHGLEIQDGRRVVVQPAAFKARRALRTLHRRLARALGTLPGLLVENKTYSLSIHFRRLSARALDRFRRLWRPEAAALSRDRRWEVRRGKKVFEIRPAVRWDKGSAVRWFRKKKPGYAVYVGDDRTDEDAFRALSARGASVRVGFKKGSRARYFLRSQREIPRLLKQLLAIG